LTRLEFFHTSWLLAAIAITDVFYDALDGSNSSHAVMNQREVESVGRTSSWVAVLVVLFAFYVGFKVGGRGTFGTGGTKTAYASLDLNCGGTTYTVSTGTSGGECKSSGQNAVCGDGGNTTEVSCASGCIDANGSASCSIKAQ